MHSTEWTGQARSEQRPKTPGPMKAATEVTVTMHYNGDYSGNVKISLPSRIADSEVAHNPYGKDESHTTVTIPFAALKSFVLQSLRSKLVERIEDMSDEQFEDILTGGL